uniref:Armadillo repeat-containing protein 8 n=1 Tax=Octactis speculum TaxID=3111310 RepID=A0A7S2BCS4_9STRA
METSNISFPCGISSIIFRITQLNDSRPHIVALCAQALTNLCLNSILRNEVLSSRSLQKMLSTAEKFQHDWTVVLNVSSMLVNISRPGPEESSSRLSLLEGVGSIVIFIRRAATIYESNNAITYRLYLVLRNLAYNRIWREQLLSGGVRELLSMAEKREYSDEVANTIRSTKLILDSDHL